MKNQKLGSEKRKFKHIASTESLDKIWMIVKINRNVILVYTRCW